MITLGSITSGINPTTMTVVRQDKTTAIRPTYSGAVYFGWPATMVGKSLHLTWDYLDAATFVALDALYVADAAVTFNPDDGSGKTYSVNLTALDGEYHVSQGSSTGTVRKNVKLTLLIMAEI